MATITVEVNELPARIAEIMSLATTGTEVIVTANQVPLAWLIPLKGGGARIPGLHAGVITTTPDFDDPLPDDFWLGEP